MSDKYEVIDNFLSDKDFNDICSKIMSPNFPWYYNSNILVGVAPTDDTPFQFVHPVYNSNQFVQSNVADIFIPVLKRLDPNLLIRLKLNLGPKTTEHLEGGWHTDQDIPGSKTAILYFNTNNGYTMFEDGYKSESVANRFVSFDRSLKHTGVSQTDTQTRCLLNINYIP
jgi:hypothetical protein